MVQMGVDQKPGDIFLPGRCPFDFGQILPLAIFGIAPADLLFRPAHIKSLGHPFVYYLAIAKHMIILMTTLIAFKILI
jgi:hypothetical protein